MLDLNGDLCPLAVFSGEDRKPIFQVKPLLNLVKPQLKPAKTLKTAHKPERQLTKPR